MDTGHAQGDLAHTLVLETFEQLSHALEQEGEPLFIISALDYDNYLARVKAPPHQKGKENRPKAQKVSNNTKQNDEDMNILIKDTETGHREQTHGKNAKQDLIVPQGKSVNNEKSSKLDSEFEDKVLLLTRDNECMQKEMLADAYADSATKDQSKTLLGTAAKYDTDEKAEKNSGREQPVEIQNAENQSATVKHKAKKQKKKKKKKAIAEDMTEVESSVIETMNVDSSMMASEMQQTPRKPLVGKGLPPTPRDITNTGLRGDIDIMLLHKEHGVVLIEVKATGHPGWCHTDEQIRDRVQKAIQQVKRGRDVFHFIMPDLSCEPCVTLVVAFPYLTKQQLDQVLAPLPSDPEILFLCKDDMINFSEVPSEHNTTSAAGSDHSEEAAADQLAILAWWNNNLVTAKRGSPLPLEDMKTIVGRTCGLLSVVSVWTRTKPRVEIRTAGQAISQVADRFSNIVLLPKQASLLAHPSPSYLCLTGPMGSGKTLMLQLKGRQWVQEGKRVVVLNVRAAGKGRPIGHSLEQAIKSVESAGNMSSSVERHDLATKELDLQTFHAELERRGPTDKLCFVLDEVTPHSFFLLDDLRMKYPNCCIWCVAMFLRQLPVGFQHFRLGAVLRSPPSVQLLLKELDLHPSHRDAYSTRSAARGLPCDGPPVIFIQHKQHSIDTWLYGCEHCADRFVDVLQNTLGLVFPSQQEAAPTQSGSLQKPGKPRAQPKAVQAKPLSFRDIILLVSVPIGYCKQLSIGTWSSSKEGVSMFFEYVQSCPFVTRLKQCGVPVKIMLDNTSPEVALSTTDEILVADVFGFHGLERKVVLFLPGGPVLGSTPDKTGSSDSSFESSGAMEKSVKSSTDHLSQPEPSGEGITTKETVSVSHSEHTEENTTKSAHSNTVTQNSSLNVPNTNTAQTCSTSTETPKLETKETKTVSRCTESIVMHPAEPALSGKKPPHMEKSQVTEATPAEGSIVPQSIKPRMGMDLRGDSPLLMSAKGHIPDSSMSVNHEEFTYASEPAEFFSAQSVFLVPDVQQEGDHRKSEVIRIREAIASLSMDDQDWLFVAAARCLSQLIVVIPSMHNGNH